MARMGGMYGPDATFLGVPKADLEDPASWAGTDILIIGAPFDGGTSHRPGARFGPQAIRFTDYLPHDGSRPHLALGVDPLAEMRVADAGDVEMPSGDTERSLRTPGGGRPVGLPGRRAAGDPRRRPHHHLPRRDRGGPARGLGAGVAHPLRRARRYRRHPVRLAVRARHPDAAAHRVRRRAGRPVPADRAARLLAGAGDAGLDGRPADAQLSRWPRWWREGWTPA